jgi:hypothetical protein
VNFTKVREAQRGLRRQRGTATCYLIQALHVLFHSGPWYLNFKGGRTGTLVIRLLRRRRGRRLRG